MAHVGEELALGAGRRLCSLLCLLELRFESFLIGDIASNSIEQIIAGCCTRAGPCQPTVRAILAAIAVLEIDDIGSLEQAGEHAHGHFLIIRVNKLEERLCQKLLVRVTQDLAEHRIDRLEIAIQARGTQHVQRHAKELVSLRRTFLDTLLERLVGGGHALSHPVEHGGESAYFVARAHICSYRLITPAKRPRGLGETADGTGKAPRKKVCDDNTEDR